MTRPYYVSEMKDAVGTLLGYVVYREHMTGVRPPVVAEYLTHRAGRGTAQPCPDLATAHHLAETLARDLNS
jgi:hypothetical protein